KGFDKARTFGVECFRDENNAHWVYISEVGSIAALPGAASAKPEAKSKAPTWMHGLDLKCRKGGEKGFDKAKAFGVEAFRDENNGNWIYIAETGAIAVVPGNPEAKGGESKTPTWMHGLDLKCRKAGEKEFDKAATFGVEAFRDENNGNWIYITETGSIAVVP